MGRTLQFGCFQRDILDPIILNCTSATPANCVFNFCSKLRHLGYTNKVITKRPQIKQPRLESHSIPFIQLRLICHNIFHICNFPKKVCRGCIVVSLEVIYSISLALRWNSSSSNMSWFYSETFVLCKPVSYLLTYYNTLSLSTFTGWSKKNGTPVLILR